MTHLHANDTIIIVAHGGTLHGCLAHLLPEALGEAYASHRAPPGAATVQVVARKKAPPDGAG